MNTILPYFRLDTDSLWQTMPGKTLALSDSLFEEMSGQLKSKLDGPVGFYHWPAQIPKNYLDSVNSIAKELRDNFEGAVIFGIGGSYLGPATVVEALAPEPNKFPIYWLSNCDSPEMKRLEQKISGRKFAAIVISKSGSTVETLSAFFHLSRHFDPKGIVAVTDPEKGELRRLATAQKWKTLDVPPSIGGRFSVLTAVGLLPVALAGLSSNHLIEGANRMRTALESTRPAENPAFRLAAGHYMWDINFQKNVHVFMAYEKRLKLFADWWVQLFGESLGKKLLKDQEKSVGFTPLSAMGTSDQHSLLQLFKEGPRDKIVGFMSVYRKEDQIKVSRPAFEVKDLNYLFEHSFDEMSHFACLATQQSLKNSGVPTFRIDFARLDEATLGSLFFFFETACAFAGELYGVDAFNQPGVEEAKRLLKQSLT